MPVWAIGTIVEVIQGIRATAIAKRLNIGRASVYRHLSE